MNNKSLVNFCLENGIKITAYSPFGSPTRPWMKPGDPVLNLDNPILVNIGKTYRKTSSQVILRYLIDIGTIPIPKSTNKDRIKANLDVFDFKLTESEIQLIDTLDCNGRVCHAEELRGMPNYPFEEV